MTNFFVLWNSTGQRGSNPAMTKWVGVGVKTSSRWYKSNPRTAEELIDEFTSKSEMLARHTGVGSPRPNVDSRAHIFPVGRYLIVFRRHEDGIEVMRVAHSARDLKKLKLP